MRLRVCRSSVVVALRRQPLQAGAQLTLEDVDGWRFHAIIVTIIPGWPARAEVLEHHRRLRGCVPDEALHQLKGDFGLRTPRCATSLATRCGGSWWPWCWRDRRASEPAAASGRVSYRPLSDLPSSPLPPRQEPPTPERTWPWSGSHATKPCRSTVRSLTLPSAHSRLLPPSGVPAAIATARCCFLATLGSDIQAKSQSHRMLEVRAGVRHDSSRDHAAGPAGDRWRVHMPLSVASAGNWS